MLNTDNNYLKYWRVVRFWAKAKYNLRTPELEMLLFLYSEEYFNKTKFKEFEQLMAWDVNRFNNLLKEGWIKVWRKKGGKHTTLYELSYKGKRVVATIYKKLSGEEIAESPGINPLFRADANYMQKIYRSSIKKMNDFIKQQRYLSQ